MSLYLNFQLQEAEQHRIISIGCKGNRIRCYFTRKKKQSRKKKQKVTVNEEDSNTNVTGLYRKCRPGSMFDDFKWSFLILVLCDCAVGHMSKLGFVNQEKNTLPICIRGNTKKKSSLYSRTTISLESRLFYFSVLYLK